MGKTVSVDKKTSGLELPGFRTWLRRFGTVLLVVVGCLALGSYVVVYWAERQILTTDNWVQLVSPLTKDSTVSKALADTITGRLFAKVPIQDEIAAALPPRAAFLVTPLTNQVQTVTANVVQKTVSSDQFQAVWEGANRLAMNRLLATARGQTPPLRSAVNERFTIDLSGSTGQLRQALGRLSDVFPALQPATSQAITISEDLQARPRRLQQIVKAADFAAAVLPLLIIASLLWALAWSHDRRRTLLWLSLTIIGLMLLELIGIKVLRQQVLDKVQIPSNLSAVGIVFDMLVSWLRRMIYIVAMAAVVVLLVLFVFGPAEWARRVRGSLQLERINQSGFVEWWRAARTWLSKREYYIWLGIAGVALIATAFVANGNTRTLVNALLLLLSAFALVHLLATPRRWAA